MVQTSGFYSISAGILCRHFSPPPSRHLDVSRDHHGEVVLYRFRLNPWALWKVGSMGVWRPSPWHRHKCSLSARERKPRTWSTCPVFCLTGHSNDDNSFTQIIALRFGRFRRSTSLLKPLSSAKAVREEWRWMPGKPWKPPKSYLLACSYDPRWQRIVLTQGVSFYRHLHFRSKFFDRVEERRAPGHLDTVVALYLISSLWTLETCG